MLLVWECGWLVGLGVRLRTPSLGMRLVGWFGSEAENS